MANGVFVPTRRVPICQVVEAKLVKRQAALRAKAQDQREVLEIRLALAADKVRTLILCTTGLSLSVPPTEFIYAHKKLCG